MQKFGIEVPRSYNDCVYLDQQNNNTLWQAAVWEEMSKVWVAFQVLADGESIPPTYQMIWCHMVYDVKMENFRHKAQFVAGGHMTEAPMTITYVSVVSHELVHITLTLAALNGLGVKTTDIENMYLTAPVNEKIWCTLGPKFGSDARKPTIVVHSLYGLKYAGATFCNHLADCMRHLGWQSCMADQDLWLQPKVKSEDGHKYYAYALLCVDDILVIHHDVAQCLKDIDQFFKMKPRSVGDPDFYLGAKLHLIQLLVGLWLGPWAQASTLKWPWTM